MSLAPHVDVTLGSLRYDTHVSSLSVTLALLPAVNSFTLTLPASVKFTAAPGDDAKLEVDGGDRAGDGKRTLLTGKVRRVRRTITGIQVTAADAGADLAALRPATTYQSKDAAGVIKALASEVGVKSGSIDIALDLAAFAAHQRRSGAEHIAYLARLGGCIGHVGGDGNLNVIERSDRAEAALLHGRELIEFERTAASPPAAQMVAVGSGSAGSTGAPDALKHSLERLPRDAVTAGKTARYAPAAVLRTPKTASAATEALSGAAAVGASRMRARCFLLTGLRPGMVVEVQELPGALGGTDWLLTRVTHSLTPDRGGETVLEGIEAGDGSGLLGALLGAIGGLL